MSDTTTPPHTIVIAGVPRSGSTWLFNAARRLLEVSGADLHAAWIEDYEAGSLAATHLVKVHQPRQLTFEPELILTTRRPPEARIASVIRMGWIANEPDEIRRAWKNHQTLYDHWQARSDLEIDYDEIMNAPAAALARIAAVLRLEMAPAALETVAAELAQMKAPESGHYDPNTLLHPRHRRVEDETAPTPEDILRVIEDPSISS